MILRLENIFKDYEQGKMVVSVLKDINLSLEKGEYFAIMGPSGSGKSTLMNLIGCLDKPTSGQYYLKEDNIEALSEKELAKVRNRSIGFVFQRFNLLARQTALDNVALPLLYTGIPVKERKARAEEALKKVGLEDRMNFLPNQLSGGQCQRVAIARAIVTNPEILLADEPTGALDTSSGEQIMEIFKKLNEEGVTIIVITHEQEVANHAEKIAYIRDGILSEVADHGK